jgi:hypothetical protein
MIWSRFNQMPAQSLAYGENSVPLKQPEVAGGKSIVLRGMDQVQTFSVTQPVCRAFEAA